MDLYDFDLILSSTEKRIEKGYLILTGIKTSCLITKMSDDLNRYTNESKITRI
jgi:hypothetical protein